MSSRRTSWWSRATSRWRATAASSRRASDFWASSRATMWSSRWATTTPATSAIGTSRTASEPATRSRPCRSARAARRVVAIDSTKPDLDEGEVGREHYGWLDAELRRWTEGPRIVVIHHHILAVPGTGRDVNNLRDAGDVMAILRELEVDLVLSGHRHVPYVWSISGVRVVHSGTVSTLRVRGTMPPSYNVIEIDEDEVRIVMRQPGQGTQGEEPLANFARRPVTTSEFYPELERFVRYDAHPFADTGRRDEPTVVRAPAPTLPSPVAAPERAPGPTILAVLEGGPLAGRRIEVEVVE